MNRDEILIRGWTKGGHEGHEEYIEAVLDLAKEVEPFLVTSRTTEINTDYLVDWLLNGTPFVAPICPAAIAAEYDQRDMTAAEVAYDLGFSLSHVCRMLRWGKIPAHKEGGEWRIDPLSFQKYVQTTHAEAQAKRFTRAEVSIELDGSHGYSLPECEVRYADVPEAYRIFRKAFPLGTGKVKFVLTYQDGSVSTRIYRIAPKSVRLIQKG